MQRMSERLAFIKVAELKGKQRLKNMAKEKTTIQALRVQMGAIILILSNPTTVLE